MTSIRIYTMFLFPFTFPSYIHHVHIHTLLSYAQVLLGQQYTQKSDIHSLALVIWEIVSAGKVTKFYTNTNRDGNALQNNTGGLI